MFSYIQTMPPSLGTTDLLPPHKTETAIAWMWWKAVTSSEVRKCCSQDWDTECSVPCSCPLQSELFCQSFFHPIYIGSNDYLNQSDKKRIIKKQMAETIFRKHVFNLYFHEQNLWYQEGGVYDLQTFVAMWLPVKSAKTEMDCTTMHFILWLLAICILYYKP